MTFTGTILLVHVSINIRGWNIAEQVVRHVGDGVTDGTHVLWHLVKHDASARWHYHAAKE